MECYIIERLRKSMLLELPDNISRLTFNVRKKRAVHECLFILELESDQNPECGIIKNEFRIVVLVVRISHLAPVILERE